LGLKGKEEECSLQKKPLEERRRHPMKELYLDDRDINEVWQEFDWRWRAILRSCSICFSTLLITGAI